MNPPPNFNALARLYRWMELASFGPCLMRCRSAWLDRLGQARRALILGDGDGRFTARLLKENPYITVDAVDASPAMLAALLRHAGTNAARVKTHVADARAWQPPDAQYGLVVTHFFLDCLTTEEVAALARTIRRAVSGEALWVVSEFAVPDGLFGVFVARPLVASLYLAFGWLTGLAVRRLPDHESGLRAAGFTLIGSRSQLGGLLVAQLWRPDAEFAGNST